MHGSPSEAVREVPPLLTQTWETATRDPDPLVALGAARALHALLSTWEAKLASEAVTSGATWEAIGSSVGVSRQAAWQRFHHDVDDFRRHFKDAARTLKERQREEWREFRDDVKRRARGGPHR